MDLASLLGDQKVEITCPGCTHTFNAYAKNVFKKNAKLTCPGCNSDIDIENNESLKGIEKSLKELTNAFKDFGK